MATGAKQSFLKNFSKFIPTTPPGPPIPRKEILAILRAVRRQLDRLIAKFEAGGKPPRKAATRRKAASRRKAATAK